MRLWLRDSGSNTFALTIYLNKGDVKQKNT